MTHEEKMKLYEKVGKGMTEIFKEKYPSLCYIKIEQEPPLVIKGVEYHYDIYLTVASRSLKSDEKLPDIYIIEKSIYNYFDIRIDHRERKIFKKWCPSIT